MAKSSRAKKKSAGRKRSRRAVRKQRQGFFSKKWVWGIGLVVAVGVVYFIVPRATLPPAPEVSPLSIAKYPHDTTAFTQGLLIEDGKLYESTGQYGKSRVRRVDLRTGETEISHLLEKSYFGEGLAALDGRLYQLTWKAGKCFVYNQESLMPLDTLALPTKEGWGLTEDGEHLILSDGSDRLRFLIPETLEVVREVEVQDGGQSVSRLNELEYVNGLVYANVWQNSRVAIIDPVDGAVVTWLNLNWLNVLHSPIDGADVLNGIAYDEVTQRLYLTGKLWPSLYAFKVPQVDRLE